MKKTILKDILWYFTGMTIPLVINVIRSPIFTSIFTPEEYGYYSLVIITYSYISILLYSWIAHCIWRYYNNYKKDNNLVSLYSNLFILFLLSNIILIVISFIWILNVNNLLTKKLIILSVLQIPLSQIISSCLIIDRLEGKSFKYNIIHSIQAFFSFFLTYYLAFNLSVRIESILEGRIIIDFFLCLYLLLSSFKLKAFSCERINYELIKKFTLYGFVGMICGLSLMILTSSDRYIISLFEPIASVGIYNQIYNLAQLSIASLIAVYFNVINPVLYKELEFNLDKYNEFIRTHIHLYIYLFLPIAVYLSLFSKEMASLLLGVKFQIGYKMIPYIMISYFFYGLRMFIEVKLKFLAQYRNVIVGFIYATIINIVLNIIFIPFYGYFWAAVTTLISYCILFSYYYYRSSMNFINTFLFKELRLFVLILIIQISADLFIRKVMLFELNIWQTVLEGALFYGICLCYLLLKRKSLPIHS